MASSMMVPNTEYSLAEASISSQPGVSGSTAPDALARPAVITAAVEPPATVVIRKRGPELPVEVQASGTLARSFVKSIEGVAELLGLPPGWNSYSAKPIAPQNAIRAIRLLAELLQTTTPAPAVVPRVQGGIQIEWHVEDIDIEVYVDSPEQVSFYAEDIESGESAEGPLAGREDVLKAWVRRISGR